MQRFAVEPLKPGTNGRLFRFVEGRQCRDRCRRACGAALDEADAIGFAQERLEVMPEAVVNPVGKTARTRLSYEVRVTASVSSASQ